MNPKKKERSRNPIPGKKPYVNMFPIQKIVIIPVVIPAKRIATSLSSFFPILLSLNYLLFCL